MHYFILLEQHLQKTTVRRCFRKFLQKQKNLYICDLFFRMSSSVRHALEAFIGKKKPNQKKPMMFLLYVCLCFMFCTLLTLLLLNTSLYHQAYITLRGYSLPCHFDFNCSCSLYCQFQSHCCFIYILLPIISYALSYLSVLNWVCVLTRISPLGINK